MAYPSDESLLSEEVDPTLLDESNLYTVILVDGIENRTKQVLHPEVEVKNPFSFDPNDLLPNAELMDLPRFYDIASQVILDAQRREGIVDGEIVKLVQEYQPEDFEKMGDEVITARVLSREPGKMSTDGKSRPHWGSTFEYNRRAAQYPNKILEVRSRPIDHTIELTCWAKTATLANKRALWLEKLFTTHAWAFKSQGVDRFFWKGRGPDEVWKHEEQRLHRRPLRFFLRLFEFEVYGHPVLKRIDYTVSTV